MPLWHTDGKSSWVDREIGKFWEKEEFFCLHARSFQLRSNYSFQLHVGLRNISKMARGLKRTKNALKDKGCFNWMKSF